MVASLPMGRTGQALAAALLLLVAVAAWQAVAAPLLGLYADRAEALAGRNALARRMDQVAAGLPGLRAASQAAPGGGAPAALPTTLMDGASGAVAGAALQQMVQDMAVRAGATLGSIEALPAEPAGRYRRIAVRASVSATWPAMVRLLQSLGEAQPALLVDDLQLRGPGGAGLVADPPMDGTLTVITFQAAERT